MLLTKLGVLLAKIETTVGTDAVPTSTDGACNFFNVSIGPAIAMQQRQGQGGFGKLASIPEGFGCNISFQTQLEWDGTATEPFWADVLLPACGYVKSGQVFTPRSEAPGSNVKTLTFYHYLNGKLRKIYGAAGNGAINLPTGNMGFIDWTFTGVWGGETDAAIVSPTYPTVLPIRATGLNELGDVALCASNVTIDLGNTVVLRECTNNVSGQLRAGYHSAIITDRTPLITVDPEAKLVATRDAYGSWIASTEAAWEYDVAGPTNSLLVFDAPKAQIISNADGDRNGIAIDTLQLQCNKNGATHDQELSITFTAAT
jgi:hypothetical protein